MMPLKYFYAALLACLACGCSSTEVSNPRGTQEPSLMAVEPLPPLSLRPHPRLWVNRDTVAHLKNKLHSPFLRSQAARVLADADWLLEAAPLAEKDAPTHQRATRAIASRLQCLTAAWVLTRDARYRSAALQNLQNILNWNHISCESNRHMPAEAPEFFCLSYGEHCADIALMYDVFRSDITPEEQKVFFDVLDRFYLRQALACVESPPWWAFKEWSNWNGVCAGGMGMLALAFYDDKPACRRLIPFVEKSLAPYFASYIKNGGGNHEGTGYWNYGMHYSLRYLLSWENATGKKHPAFAIPELGKSLHFPLDFTGITFGDNDGWHPAGFFFLAAKRLNQPRAARRAAVCLSGQVPVAPKNRHPLLRVATGDLLYGADAIPDAASIDALKAAHGDTKEPLLRVYKGLDWAILADDWVAPALRLSVRGGSSKISGHGMMDLLSFKCMVNKTLMIGDQQDGGYLPTTFTSRGIELYGRSSASKSTLFVDGVGCRENVRCRATEGVRGKNLLGVRLDGSGAVLRWRRIFVGRLFLLVEGKYWLILDAVRDPGRNAHWLESRFHTYASVESEKNTARLTRDEESLSVTFAAHGGGVLQRARGLPSTPRAQTHMLRWMGRRPRPDCFHATALNPGPEKLDLKLAPREDGGFAVEVSGPQGYRRTIEVTARLQLKEQ